MAVRVRRSVVVSNLIVLVELAEVVALLFGFIWSTLERCLPDALMR